MGAPGERDPVLLTLAEALVTEPRPTLVWGEGLAGLRELVGSYELACVTDHLPTARRAGCRLAVEPRGEGLARIVLRQPRAKALLEMRLAIAASRLAPGGELWVVGHQRDGVRAAERLLAARGASVSIKRLKRRCRVLGTELEAPARALPPSAFEVRLELATKAGPLTVVSLPGVFGHGRLDRGTALVLEQLERSPPRFGRALDLGSGAGVLGAWLARARPPATVELLDVSATACAASRATLSANDLSAQVHLALSDDLPAGVFDLVVSNPPRHEGRDHAHALAAEVIAAAGRRLKRGGRFLCVANHNREVSRALDAHFRRVELRHHDRAYRVWEATR